MSLWIVGGYDPTGGAGVTRDRSVAAELAPDLEPTVVITALTQQGDRLPARAQPTALDELRAALSGIGDARAVKIGVVPAACAEVVGAALARVRAPRVLDPVLRASDGGDMGASLDGLRELLPHVDLITPNHAEAIALLGGVSHDDDALVTAVAKLGGTAVLVKDGHGSDPAQVCDRLVHAGRCVTFARPRIAGPDPRGTGCALATAITCALVGGLDLEGACRSAIAWLDVARTHTRVGPDGRPHLVSRRPASRR